MGQQKMDFVRRDELRDSIVQAKLFFQHLEQYPKTDVQEIHILVLQVHEIR